METDIEKKSKEAEEKEIRERLGLIDDFLDNLAEIFPPDYLITMGVMGERCLTIKIGHKGQSQYVSLFARPKTPWEENKKEIREQLVSEFLKMEETWLKLSINGAWEGLGL